MKKILQDLSYNQIEELVLSLGEKKFRAKQLYEGLMQGKTITGITSLSKDFKQRLCEEYEDEPVKIKETFYSSDGTEKYLFEYADGNLVEGVLMKYKYGYTQCVSTQVPIWRQGSSARQCWSIHPAYHRGRPHNSRSP